MFSETEFSIPVGKETVVTPGELITTETDLVRGHGTQMVEGRLLAMVAGTVHRVNKLITVKPFHSRYVGEVGDVIVARVTGVFPNLKRWKADVNAKQDAQLMLSAVNLPGGVQRRKTYEDELQMRTFFDEGDLISCEVQSVYQDGGLAIHTRSMRYGKLSGGQIVVAPPSLIKRSRNHFQNFSCGVQVIIGTNGYIWIAPIAESESQGITLERRQNAARIANSVLALSTFYLPIYSTTITDVFSVSIEEQMSLPDMLIRGNQKTLIEPVYRRILADVE